MALIQEEVKKKKKNVFKALPTAANQVRKYMSKQLHAIDNTFLFFLMILGI